MSENNPFTLAMAAYRQAVLAKDAEAFAALYDPDIHVFDMWSSWSLRGVQAWRKMAEDWFSSLGDEYVVVTVDEENCTSTEDLAIGHAVLTYTAFSPDGSKVRSLGSRATMALRKAGDAWKIFHEHTSAPIDHQSRQAILHRSGN